MAPNAGSSKSASGSAAARTSEATASVAPRGSSLWRRWRVRSAIVFSLEAPEGKTTGTAAGSGPSQSELDVAGLLFRALVPADHRLRHRIDRGEIRLDVDQWRA